MHQLFQRQDSVSLGNYIWMGFRPHRSEYVFQSSNLGNLQFWNIFCFDLMPLTISTLCFETCCINCFKCPRISDTFAIKDDDSCDRRPQCFQLSPVLPVAQSFHGRAPFALPTLLLRSGGSKSQPAASSPHVCTQADDNSGSKLSPA